MVRSEESRAYERICSHCNRLGGSRLNRSAMRVDEDAVSRVGKVSKDTVEGWEPTTLELMSRPERASSERWDSL